jgi:hypothetical protein
MLKGIATLNDRKTLMLGLSFNNLDKFRAEPRDTFIKVEGEPMGLPFDVLIFSGESEAHLAHFIRNAVTDKTIIHIDPKLKQ